MNFVYVAASIDGYIATPDGSVDWLEYPNPERSDFGFADFVEGIDAIVLGRNTFEKVLSFDAWPYHKPVYVVSRTLSAVPEHLTGRVQIIDGDPQSIVDLLAECGHVDLYIDGGRLIQSFLEDDLIDRMIITRIPIVLGQGIPLFGSQGSTLRFTLESSEVLIGQLVMSRYVRDRT